MPPFRRSTPAATIALFADPMFEFPDAEGGEEKRFGSGQGAGSSHYMFAVLMTVRATAWATRFFASLRFADGFGSWTGDESVAAVHNYCISCKYQDI